jgi:uncharacterized damage-inducible protein DinB
VWREGQAAATIAGMRADHHSIRPFYRGWDLYNQAIVDVVTAMSAAQLALRPDPDRWPIWATVAHTAGARVYWLCGVFGEPGAETTPFPEVVSGEGWEDDPETPRNADELVEALTTSWAIIDGCLDRWTPETLDRAFQRPTARGRQRHTRQSVLMRLLAHDAYHCGELSQTLGIHGLPQIDLWPPTASQSH